MRNNEMIQLKSSSGNQYDDHFFSMVIHKKNELTHQIEIEYLLCARPCPKS